MSGLSKPVEENALILELRTFELIWPQLTPAKTCSHIRRACEGWTAMCNIFSSENKVTPLAQIEISLDAEEVWVQVRQSIRLDYSGNWAIRFPLSISDDGLCFMVLRTMFRLNPQSATEPACCKSFKLPLSFSEKFEESWWEHFHEFYTPVKSHSPIQTILSRRCEHFYMTKFSSDNHLFFADWEFGKGGHLAVFQITVSEALQADLVGLWAHSDVAHLTSTRVAFHPTKPIVSFWDLYVRLWHYGKRKNSLRIHSGNYRKLN